MASALTAYWDLKFQSLQTKGSETSGRRVIRSVHLKIECIPRLRAKDIMSLAIRKCDDSNDESRDCVLIVNYDFACENKIELGKTHNIK